MLIIIDESSRQRPKLSHHPVNAGERRLKQQPIVGIPSNRGPVTGPGTSSSPGPLTGPGTSFSSPEPETGLGGGSSTVGAEEKSCCQLCRYREPGHIEVSCGPVTCDDIICKNARPSKSLGLDLGRPLLKIPSISAPFNCFSLRNSSARGHYEALASTQANSAALSR